MKKKISILMIFMVTMIAAACFSGCVAKVQLDLSKYASVIFDGVDGEGTAIEQFDYVKMESYVIKTFTKGTPLEGKEKEELLKMEGDEAELVSAFLEFENSIKFRMDKPEGLSNGDKVTLTITYDKAKAQKARVEITGTAQKTFTVKDLPEFIEVQAFDSSIFDKTDGIELEFTNLSGYGELRIKNHLLKKTPEKFLKYEADKTENIANGDKIKITASLDKAAPVYFVLNDTEKVITVQGLDQKVTGLYQLKPEDREKTEERIQEFLESQKHTGFTFLAENGQEFLLSSGKTEGEKVKYGEFTLEGSEYIPAEDVEGQPDPVVTIISYTVDFDRGLWDQIFNKDQIPGSLEDNRGYIVIEDFTTDYKGQLNGEMKIKVCNQLFATKEQMNAHILENYNMKEDETKKEETI